MDKFWFLVKYNLFKRIKRKSFIVINVILLILVVGMCNIPNIFSAVNKMNDDEVNLVFYDQTNESDSYISFESENINCSFVSTTFSEDGLDGILENNEAVILLKFDENNILTSTIYSYGLDQSLKDELELTLQNAKLLSFKAHNPTLGDTLDDYLNSNTFTYNDLEDDSLSEENSILGVISMIIILPIFILIVFLMQYLGMDIIEEKSSRSIEYIISNVKPSHHFGSKILAIVFYLLIQGALFAVYAGIGMGLSAIISVFMNGGASQSYNQTIDNINQDVNINVGAFLSRLPIILIFTFLFVIIGITFYIVIEALLSAMATSIEDFQQFQTPIMLLLVIGFYIGIFTSFTPGASFVKILGYLPFFSPILAPMLLINGAYEWYNALISLVILGAFDVLIIKYGLPIYRVSLLDYSQDKVFVKLKAMIKKAKDSK